MEILNGLTKEILSILKVLGINHLVYYHLGIFLIGYCFLYFLVFRPYFRVFQERQKKAFGDSDLMEQMVEDIQQMETEYQSKAREVNEHYKKVYDQCRQEAMEESNETVHQARQEAKHLMEKKRQEIQKSVQQARKQLFGEKKQVTRAIVTQVLGGRE